MSDTPEVGSSWRHLKRGTIYTVEAVGKLQVSDRFFDMTDVVVYRGEDGLVWVRPVVEFLDGRFERVMTVGPATELPTGVRRALNGLEGELRAEFNRDRQQADHVPTIDPTRTHGGQ